MLASNIKTVATRYGEFSYYADDARIGASLAQYGEYSELELALLRQIIKPGWTVLDVGANIGCLTVPFAQMVGDDGHVIAFEAQPENYELLQSNTVIYDNIDAQHVAVGASAGRLKAPPLRSLLHRNYGKVELGGDFGDAVEVVPLDTLVERASFIKVDVEGMECEVLRGAKQLIERCRPILYLENDRQDRSNELLQILTDYDYVGFTHKPPMFNPKNFFGAGPSGDFDYVSGNLLAVPREQVPVYPAVIEQLKPAAPRRPKRLIGADIWAGFARCGGIGDNLVAASACKPLKDLGFLVEVISQEPHHVLFENNPYIDKLSIYTEHDWNKDPVEWNKWFNTRGKEYARFVNLGHSMEVRHAAFPTMTSYWWPKHYRRKIFGGSYLETVHDLLDIPYVFDRLFWPTDEEVEVAQDTRAKLGDGPIIGWCCNGTRIDKVYPQAPQTIGRLINELGAKVVLIGRGPGSKDYELVEQTFNMVEQQNGSTDGLSHAGGDAWPVRRAVSFAQAVDLLIGPDTGVMWGAAMEPNPKILLHGHASVDNITRHWRNTVSLHADPDRVDCWPCHRLQESDIDRTCRWNKWKNGAACITDITVEQVVSAATKLLR